jgi:hypothetical protein
MADMKAKGRAFRMPGESHVLAKLTELDVLEIRQRIKAGEYQQRIADLFGVSNQLISAINTKAAWGHI